MIFTHDFRKDCRDLLESLQTKPIALSRYCDGEYAILTGKQIPTADKWTVPDLDSSFTADLKASLEYSDPDYYVGISPACCLPEEHLYYLDKVSVPHSQLTFANVFVDANHNQVVSWTKDTGSLDTCAIVSSSNLGHYRVPANVVNEDWDIDGLVKSLFKETRPILVAAGPASGIIIHKYWKRQSPDKRVTILDVGSAFDVWLHGRPTRGYHMGDSDNRKKVCSWTNLEQHSTRSGY